MKLIQINVWCGRVVNSTLKFIKNEDPDIITAQEVVHSENTVPGLFDSYNIHRLLLEIYPYHYFSPTFDYSFFGTKVFFGNAIYSKYPLSETSTTFTHGKYALNRSVKSAEGENIRNIQKAIIDIDGKSITVLNHHGYHSFDPLGDETSMVSMSSVIQKIKKCKGAIILSGDFNVEPNCDVIKLFRETKLLNHTIEANPKTTLSELSRVPVDVVCDYILSSEEIKVNRFEVSEIIVSDHKALILEFDL